MSFVIENVINVPSLDMRVSPSESLEQDYDLIVLDPGEMVGWAGVRYGAIEVGQLPWHACLGFGAYQVYIERTPFASRLTFDPWPLYYTGMVIAKLYPMEPHYVLPTNLKVAQKWFKLPRSHGLGPHAKDALAHLVYVLVRQGVQQ